MDVAQCPDRPSTPFLFEEPAIRSSCASSPLNQGLRNGGGIGDILRASSIKVSLLFPAIFFSKFKFVLNYRLDRAAGSAGRRVSVFRTSISTAFPSIISSPVSARPSQPDDPREVLDSLGGETVGAHRFWVSQSQRYY